MELAPPYYAFMGLLGATLYVLVWAKNWDDLKKFESVRHMMVGAIVGFIYSILHFEYSFPNTIMALVAGYMGTDFIEALIEKLKPSLQES